MPAHNLIHGGDVYTAMENGLERPLDFSANIGPLGLPPAVAEAARRLAPLAHSRQGALFCYP